MMQLVGGVFNRGLTYLWCSIRGKVTSVTGGIILCGGRSERMGRDKALLPFRAATLLETVVGRLAEFAPPERLVCVAAADQALPPLPPGVIVVRDEHPNAGPLAALASGLRALPAEVELVAAVACDTPLVSAAVLRLLVERRGEAAAVVPRVAGHLQPLLAVYQRRVLPKIEELLSQQRRSLHALVEGVETLVLEEKTLREVDPQLLSFLGCNTPAEYTSALNHPVWTNCNPSS